MVLPSQIILGAIHACYADSYWSAMEELDISPPAGSHLERITPFQPDAVMFPIAMYWLGLIHGAWGKPVGHVLVVDLKITDPVQQEQALFDLFMGCIGHGISLADDYGDQLDALGLDHAPVHIDGEMWFLDLAAEAANHDSRRWAGRFLAAV